MTKNSCTITTSIGNLVCTGEKGCCPGTDFANGAKLSFDRPTGDDLERRRAAARARFAAVQGNPTHRA